MSSSNISTHAPRTGSDSIKLVSQHHIVRFQPTLPARGATVSEVPIAMMRSNEFGKELQRFAEPLLQKNSVRISMRRIGKNRSRVLTVEKVGQNPQTTMDFTPVPNDDVPF